MKETTGTSSPASTAPKKGAARAAETEKTQKPQKAKAKGGRNYKPNGTGNGGKRDHAGRLTKAERLQALGVSDTIEAHLVQEVELTDGKLPDKPKEGAKPIISKKPRLVAILDMLATQALATGSVPAATEYLNRTLGRAKQTVEVSGAIKTEEQAMPSKAEMAAASAYEDALEDEDDGS